MPGDVRTYDYAVLDNCIDLMKRKVQEIEERTQQLARQVTQLMGTWQGSTATTYQATATHLQTELDSSGRSLDVTRSALRSGSDNMAQTDAAGAKRF